MPVLDKPLIQYAVEEALAAGVERFVFVTGKGKDAIENHFDRAFECEYLLEQRGNHQALEKLSIKGLKPGSVVYIRQAEPLGLGHAVWCARHVIHEPFAVLLADDLIRSPQSEIGELIKAFNQRGGQWVSTQEVKPEEVEKYGIMAGTNVQDATSSYRVATHVVEKPQKHKAPSKTALLGRYVLTPAIFETLNKEVNKPLQKGKEIQLTDSLCRMIPEVPLYGLPLLGRRFDCGHMRGLFEALLHVASETPELNDLLKQGAA